MDVVANSRCLGVLVCSVLVRKHCCVCCTAVLLCSYSHGKKSKEKSAEIFFKIKLNFSASAGGITNEADCQWSVISRLRKVHTPSCADDATGSTRRSHRKADSRRWMTTTWKLNLDHAHATLLRTNVTLVEIKNAKSHLVARSSLPNSAFRGRETPFLTQLV